jgi:hypothetical protein
MAPGGDLYPILEEDEGQRPNGKTLEGTFDALPARETSQELLYVPAGEYKFQGPRHQKWRQRRKKPLRMMKSQSQEIPVDPPGWSSGQWDQVWTRKIPELEK